MVQKLKLTPKIKDPKKANQVLCSSPTERTHFETQMGPSEKSTDRERLKWVCTSNILLVGIATLAVFVADG